MNIRCGWIFFVLAILVSCIAFTHANRRHCVLTTRSIHQALTNPCHLDRRHTFHHPVEPSNICFLKNGRIVTSLQAMLETLNATYTFTPEDMDLLFDISLDLPRLDSYTTSQYINGLRQYYRELSCLAITMNRVEVSVDGRPRQQHLCNIVSRHVRPMLCVDTGDEVELDPLPRDCSDWTNLDPDRVNLYAYWTIKYFGEFLAALSPTCRITLRG